MDNHVELDDSWREETESALETLKNKIESDSDRKVQTVVCSIAIALLYILYIGGANFEQVTNNFTQPYDADGRFCGHNQSSTQQGEDYDFSDYKYLMITDFSSKDASKIFESGVCVKECPTLQRSAPEKRLQCKPTSKVDKCPTQEEIKFNTSSLRNVCIPEFSSINLIDGGYCSYNKTLEALFQQPKFTFINLVDVESVNDIPRASKALVITLLICLVWFLLLVILMVKYAEQVIWTSLLIICCFITFVAFNQQFLSLKIYSIILAFLFLGTSVYFIHTIRFEIRKIDAATVFLNKQRRIMWVPCLISSILLWIIWTSIRLFLSIIQYSEIQPDSSSPQAKSLDLAYQYKWIYALMVLTMLICFVLYRLNRLVIMVSFMKFYNMNKENRQNEDPEARGQQDGKKVHIEIYDPFLIVLKKFKQLSQNPLQSDQASLYGIIFGDCSSKSSKNIVSKLHEKYDTEIASAILLTRFLILFPIVPFLIGNYFTCNTLMEHLGNLEDERFDQLSPNKVSQTDSIYFIVILATTILASVILSTYEPILESQFISNAIDRELSGGDYKGPLFYDSVFKNLDDFRDTEVSAKDFIVYSKSLCDKGESYEKYRRGRNEGKLKNTVNKMKTNVKKSIANLNVSESTESRTDKEQNQSIYTLTFKVWDCLNGDDRKIEEYCKANEYDQDKQSCHPEEQWIQPYFQNKKKKEGCCRLYLMILRYLSVTVLPLLILVILFGHQAPRTRIDPQMIRLDLPDDAQKLLDDNNTSNLQQDLDFYARTTCSENLVNGIARNIPFKITIAAYSNIITIHGQEVGQKGCFALSDTKQFSINQVVKDQSSFWSNDESSLSNNFEKLVGHILIQSGQINNSPLGKFFSTENQHDFGLMFTNSNIADPGAIDQGNIWLLSQLSQLNHAYKFTQRFWNLTDYKEDPEIHNTKVNLVNTLNKQCAADFIIFDTTTLEIDEDLEFNAVITYRSETSDWKMFKVYGFVTWVIAVIISVLCSQSKTDDCKPNTKFQWFLRFNMVIHIIVEFYYLFGQNHAFAFKVVYMIIMVIPTLFMFWMNYVEFRYIAGENDKSFDGCPVNIPEVKLYKKAFLLQFHYDAKETVRGKKIQDVDFAEKRRRATIFLLIFHHAMHIWLVQQETFSTGITLSFFGQIKVMYSICQGTGALAEVIVRSFTSKHQYIFRQQILYKLKTLDYDEDLKQSLHQAFDKMFETIDSFKWDQHNKTGELRKLIKHHINQEVFNGVDNNLQLTKILRDLFAQDLSNQEKTSCLDPYRQFKQNQLRSQPWNSNATQWTPYSQWQILFNGFCNITLFFGSNLLIICIILKVNIVPRAAVKQLEDFNLIDEFIELNPVFEFLYHHLPHVIWTFQLISLLIVVISGCCAQNCDQPCNYYKKSERKTKFDEKELLKTETALEIIKPCKLTCDKKEGQLQETIEFDQQIEGGIALSSNWTREVMISEHPFVNSKNSTKSHITLELHRKVNQIWKPVNLDDCSKLEQNNWSQEGEDGCFEQDQDGCPKIDVYQETVLGNQDRSFNQTDRFFDTYSKIVKVANSIKGPKRLVVRGYNAFVWNLRLQILGKYEQPMRLFEYKCPKGHSLNVLYADKFVEHNHWTANETWTLVSDKKSHGCGHEFEDVQNIECLDEYIRQPSKKNSNASDSDFFNPVTKEKLSPDDVQKKLDNRELTRYFCVTCQSSYCANCAFEYRVAIQSENKEEKSINQQLQEQMTAQSQQINHLQQQVFQKDKQHSTLLQKNENLEDTVKTYQRQVKEMNSKIENMGGLLTQQDKEIGGLRSKDDNLHQQNRQSANITDFTSHRQNNSDHPQSSKSQMHIQRK